MSRRFLGAVWALICVVLLLLTPGCLRARASKLPGGSAQKSRLTPGMVKAKIQKGKTTQTDVLETIGAPNIITRDTDGNEVWTYDVQYTASASEVAGWQAQGGLSGSALGVAGTTLIGGGASGGAGGGRSSTSAQVSSGTFTLMITFDGNEMVRDYRMLSTKF